MSRAHTPNTPRANNNTTTTHLTTTTNDVPSPRQAAVSGPLSPSATHPDLPRRSRSSSPGALNEKADADDVSIQHRDDGPANESHIGDRLSGQGQEEEEDGGVDGEGKKKEKKESMEDAKERVEEFDWEGLEGRFWDRMDECRRVEEGLREDFEEVIKVCEKGFFFLRFLFTWGLGAGGGGIVCMDVG